MKRASRKIVLSCSCAAAALISASAAWGQQRTFDIPSEDGVAAVPEFARQAGIQIVAPADQLRNIQTPALKGEFEVHAALATMLAGTGVSIASDDGQTIILAAAQKTVEAPDQQGGTALHSSGELETVVVTGSRVSRQGYEAPTPLTAVSVEQLSNANASDVADALRQMPILSATVGARGSIGSGGSGGTFLNLRNLGAGNTLVLLDGNRYVPTTSTATVDVNMLPTGLVQRVDIVTGGASAAYGSDAVTGVVNFILNREYVGLKGELEGGIDNDGGDREMGLKLAAGTAFGGGRGHLLFSAELYDSKGVYSFIETPLGQKSCAVITMPAGSPTSQSFQCDVRSSQANYGGIISGPAKLKGTTFDNNGNAIPFNYGSYVTSTTMVGGDGIKPQFVPAAEPTRRGVFYGRASWDLGSDLSAYVEAGYGVSNYDYQVGSYDQNLGSTALNITADNAYLPASLRTVMAANAITSFALNKYFGDLPRSFIQNDNSTLRFVAGLEGGFGGWKWNAHFENGQTDQYVASLYDEDLGHMVNAADAVVNPATGQIVCRSTLTNPTNGCVPFNVIGNAGLVVPANGNSLNGATDGQFNYLTGTDWKKVMIIEDNAALNASGNPFDDWAGTVSLATGLEWRHESIAQTATPYGYTAISPVTGVVGPFRLGNYQPQSGSYNVIEGYIETVVPLLRDLPLAKSVDFNGAVRETNYSTSGNAFTYKAGLTWDVTDEIRLRATDSRDVRAPNLTELYSAISGGHQSVIDYVRGTQFVNAQTQIYTQGNPALKPQNGNTMTLGAIYQSEWIAGFQASVDSYRIQITNAIASIGYQQIVLQCSQGVTSECGFILRNPDGSLFGINTEPQNLQSISTEGVDFEANYQFALQDVVDMNGDISLHGIANYVSKYIQNTAGATTVNLSGQFPNPQWRWTFQANYKNGPFSMFAQARYSGTGLSDKSLAANVLPLFHVGSQILVDVNLQYGFAVGDGLVTPYFNVTDLFNDQPPPNPIVNSNVGSNAYDTLGRYFRTGVRFSF